MKQLKIVMIVLLSMIMLALCTFLWIALARGQRFGESFRAGYSLVLEKEFSVEGIHSLKVDYGMTSNDVLIYQGTGDTVIVREYANFEPEEGQVSAVGQNGAELVIRGRRKNIFSFFTFRIADSYTEIYLPAGFAEGLETLEVKTVSGDILSEVSFGLSGECGMSSTSGDIVFPEVEAEKIRISSTSGNIRLQDAAAESVTASTVSGDISLGAVKGKMKFSTTSGNVRMEEGKGSFEANTVSGDIRTDSLEGTFQINTTSGYISLSEGKGYGKVSTTSGDIHVFLAALNGNLNISTTSGTVGLGLPETASFTFGFDSVSGECRTFFDEALSFNKKGSKAEGHYGTSENTIKISTVSGDLSVAKY